MTTDRPEKLDLRTILVIPLGQFAPWLASVLLVTWAGYPGVVCVTPVAWLMALRVGLVCVTRSSSLRPARRVQEAALGGAFFGFLQGLLFLVIVPLMGDIKPTEWTGAFMLIAFMLLGGILAGAGLAAFTASQFERRRST
jgi:hypothetical protein